VRATLQLPFETAAIRGNGGIGEIGPEATDRTRVLEPSLEVGREDHTAAVDGMLRVANQVREQNWCASACLNSACSRSDSHIFSFAPARNAVGTHLPRVSALTK
jgi:hypothetical protein